MVLGLKPDARQEPEACSLDRCGDCICMGQKTKNNCLSNTSQVLVKHETSGSSCEIFFSLRYETVFLRLPSTGWRPTLMFVVLPVARSITATRKRKAHNPTQRASQYIPDVVSNTSHAQAPLEKVKPSKPAAWRRTRLGSTRSSRPFSPSNPHSQLNIVRAVSRTASPTIGPLQAARLSQQLA